jgi:EsV-1-7 cysteine-rich motif
VPRECAEEGCIKRPSFGTVGQKARYCSEHKRAGDQDVAHRNRCAHEVSVYAVHITSSKAIYCAPPLAAVLLSANVVLVQLLLASQNCAKHPGYGFEGGKVRYCRYAHRVSMHVT